MASKRARQLRKRMTDAETCIWLHLRDRRLQNARFRRQVHIDPYVADFICFEARLIIETDGGQHSANSDQDQLRSNYLTSAGYRVLRFWNNDVLKNTDSVLSEIARHLSLAAEHPSP